MVVIKTPVLGLKREASILAADDALPNWSAADPNGTGSERTRQAVTLLKQTFEQVEQRLDGPLAPTRSDEVLQALVEALDVLAGRLEVQVNHGTHAAERSGEIVARLDNLVLDRGPTAVEPWPVRALLASASVAAALSVMGAAALAVGVPSKPILVVSANLAGLPDLRLRPSLKTVGRVAETVFWPPRAVALTPPGSPGARETHEVVAAALARGEATALARLIGLAQAGDPKAQLHLARLYETGQPGLAQDMVAAGIWTRRAAEAGERVAMHNLGLLLMQGDGGQRDVAEAATWFRRAADQGVVDSQYNLGLLYQAGQGVDRNLREAYRWFTVAANAGDGLSREKAVALEAVIKPGERAGLAREAAAFQPGAATPADPVILIPPATTLAETQALLSRQGYYLGPIDGAPNPNLEAATAAYARDHPVQGAAPRP